MFLRMFMQLSSGALTVEAVVAIVGTLLSLAASYLPKYSDWFAGLSGNWKRVFMLGMGVVVILGVLGYSCIVPGEYITCDKAGVMQALSLLWYYALANQVTYLLSPKKSS
jgi:hypothetical protein